MATLRNTISDTVNELNKLALTTRDAEQQQSLIRLREKYFRLWEAIIKQEIDNRTEDFDNAVTALQKATATIEKAKKDVKNVGDAIEKAVFAAEAVDKIVKIAFKYVV